MLLGRNFLRAFGIHFIMKLNSNKVLKPKIEINLDSERNKIRISNKILHCVYGSFGNKKSDVLMECELCRRLPNTCIANCGSEGNNNKLDEIPRIFAIDTEVFSSDKMCSIVKPSRK